MNTINQSITLRALAVAAHRMREAQREYFGTRDSSALVASKRIEREFDSMLAAILRDPDLFG